MKQDQQSSNWATEQPSERARDSVNDNVNPLSLVE